MSKNICLIVILSLLLGCNTTYKQGQRLYEIRCANCHMDDGSGVDDLIPPLKQSTYLNKSIHLLPCLIYNGIAPDTSSLIRSTVVMEPQKDLTYSEISNIANYLRWKLGEKGPYLSDQIVKDLLNDCE